MESVHDSSLGKRRFASLRQPFCLDTAVMSEHCHFCLTRRLPGATLRCDLSLLGKRLGDVWPSTSIGVLLLLSVSICD